MASPFVSAVGTLGFALGTKNPDGSCKCVSSALSLNIFHSCLNRNTGDYESDFDAIVAASGSKLVRGYAASDCNAAQQILPAAKVNAPKASLLSDLLTKRRAKAFRLC